MIALTTAQKRLLIGFLQGLLVYFLYHAEANKLWPATSEVLFSPLVAISVLVPVLVMLALDAVRARTLVLWACVATAVVAGLAVYDMTRRSDLNSVGVGLLNFTHDFPSWSTSVFTIIGFFIAQSLLMAGDAERRWIAPYPHYFDMAWKLAIQFNFVLIFVSLFWLVLWTGAKLFSLINVTFFVDLMRHDWFDVPATTLATAYSIHVTDVRVNLVRGFRTLKLATMSWLLPIMAMFVAAFMATLPFKGIDILWNTHHTSQIMLGVIAWLVVLINAVYQDGTPEHAPGRLLRYSAMLGAGLLLPLTVIGIFAVAPRVQQHGWTVHLIEVTACLVLSLGYAVGYMAAVFEKQAWLKRIEKTNIYMAFATLVVLLALFTPLADPARVSVADQMGRLRSGKVTADNFDYNYLRYQGEIYGAEALRQLKEEANAPQSTMSQAVKDKINSALSQTPYQPLPAVQPTASDLSNNIKVYPEGKALPADFAHQDWSKPQMGIVSPGCLLNNQLKCDVFLIESAPDNPTQIILLSGGLYTMGVMFDKGTDGVWRAVGNLSSRINCKGVSEALRAGRFKMVAPVDQDIEVNGMHIRTNQNEACPQE